MHSKTAPENLPRPCFASEQSSLISWAPRFWSFGWSSPCRFYWLFSNRRNWNGSNCYCSSSHSIHWIPCIHTNTWSWHRSFILNSTPVQSIWFLTLWYMCTSTTYKGQIVTTATWAAAVAPMRPKKGGEEVNLGRRRRRRWGGGTIREERRNDLEP